jgi:hypothetical protein
MVMAADLATERILGGCSRCQWVANLGSERGYAESHAPLLSGILGDQRDRKRGTSFFDERESIGGIASGGRGRR